MTSLLHSGYIDFSIVQLNEITQKYELREVLILALAINS